MGHKTYRLDTFGRIFGIARRALVNDDVGAFTDLTRRLGHAAAVPVAYQDHGRVAVAVAASGARCRGAAPHVDERPASESSAYLTGWRGYFGFCQTPSAARH